MPKTIEEINERIRKGQAVCVTAEEMIGIVKDKGAKAAAAEVDVVTTGTFGPMCSSGALINTGQATPKCKFHKAWLNGVPAYAGLAAVDFFIGATELREDDALNTIFPGRFEYGGAHAIEDLVAGKDVELRAVGYGTDCYPRRELRTAINISDLNQATLLNPRNAYQNYGVAVNRDARRVIYTYMGVLQPRMANATYCSAGQLSPLLNDPHYRTIGLGTRIFLGGAVGYVWGPGTQHNPSAPRTDNGVPRTAAGTLAVTGDMKQMDAKFVRGASIIGYGVSLAVGIGVPIPVLDEEMARCTGVRDEDIHACVFDYSTDYPSGVSAPLAEVSYAELKSGSIEVNGHTIPTAGLSSYARAREIAEILKGWIERGEFELTRPVEMLPGVDSGATFHGLRERPPARS